MPTPLIDLFNEFSPASDEEISLLTEDINVLTAPAAAAGWPNGMYPAGSNKLPLIANFMERRRYKHTRYFTGRGLPKPIDLYYDKNYYGRVDSFQDAIVPKPDNSLYHQLAQSNVFGFDFMGDAFFKLRRNMKIAIDSGAIEGILTNLGELTATKSWMNWATGYRNKQRLLYTNFFKHLYDLDALRYSKIKTFPDFLREFRNYLLNGKYNGTTTLTGFVLHKHYRPEYTGLLIDIASEDCSADAVKYNKYLTDVNFPYYVRAARKFGFYVDKNAPWRLYADVFSPPMMDTSAGKGFLVNRGVNKQTFFDTYYVRTYVLDLPYLMTALQKAWNAFVEMSPAIVDSRPGSLRCPDPTTHIYYREPVVLAPGEDLTSLIPLEYWLDLYFTCRSKETSVHYENQTVLVRRAREIADVYGSGYAVLYIHNLFKPYIYNKTLLTPFPLTPTRRRVTIGTSPSIE